MVPDCVSVRPEHQGLFPTMGSLDEVLSMAESQLPITSKNQLHTLLMTYHNTLLAQCQSNKK